MDYVFSYITLSHRGTHIKKADSERTSPLDNYVCVWCGDTRDEGGHVRDDQQKVSCMFVRFLVQRFYISQDAAAPYVWAKVRGCFVVCGATF